MTLCLTYISEPTPPAVAAAEAMVVAADEVVARPWLFPSSESDVRVVFLSMSSARSWSSSRNASTDDQNHAVVSKASTARAS